jgi:hypothetical protein
MMFLLLWWVGNIAFTKVITIYKIYHTLIHPLYHSPSSSSYPIPGIVSTVFTPYSPSQALYPPPPNFRKYQPPQAGPVL